MTANDEARRYGYDTGVLDAISRKRSLWIGDVLPVTPYWDGYLDGYYDTALVQLSKLP